MLPHLGDMVLFSKLKYDPVYEAVQDQMIIKHYQLSEIGLVGIVLRMLKFKFKSLFNFYIIMIQVTEPGMFGYHIAIVDTTGNRDLCHLSMMSGGLGIRLS